MRFSRLLGELIDALCCLPGVGPKTAQRMALLLLTRNRENGRQLAQALIAAMDHIQNCQSCRNFSETDLCEICSSAHRDSSTLCLVEYPIDVMVIEQTNIFKGRYFVLLGRLSPLDGMGPEEIGINQLKTQLATGTIREIILATSPTVEGDATAHYIATLAKPHQIKVTRIAHGVPVGSELAYTDTGTIGLALQKREVIA